MIRFGILGAGRIGKVHAATIAASKNAKVAFIADAMPKAASDLAKIVGADVVSVEDIIASKNVDAVVNFGITQRLQGGRQGGGVYDMSVTRTTEVPESTD